MPVYGGLPREYRLAFSRKRRGREPVAGKLITDLPWLWQSASLEERRKLLLAMLDAVYFEAKKTRTVVAIKPKPPFRPVFQAAASREGSDIRIINEPYKGSPVFLVETGES